MKKIEKVWPSYLKTNPDADEVKTAREFIAEPYKDFDDAYRRGIEMFKYEDWKVDWLIDVLDCAIWDLFEDTHEPTEEDYRKILEDLKKCRDYIDYMIAGYME